MESAPLQLLIVDDEEAHIEAIRRAYDSSGALVDIHAVSTLQSYREYIATNPPDLALVDLNLPDGRAVEILTHPPEKAPFPVLVMTAFGNQQIVVEVMKAGALDYVVKSPEAFTMLPRTVASAIREWQLLQSHKRVEEALRESELKYRSVFENSVVGISHALKDGRLINANQAYAEMYGYSSPDEMMRKVPYVGPCYANPDDRKEVLRILGEKGIMEPREMAVVRHDGSKLTVLVAAREIRDTSGNLLFLQAEHVDISARKLAEESHARLVTAVEQAAETILITDTNAVVLYANPAFEKTTGYTRDEIVGLTPRLLHSGKQNPEFYRQMWSVLGAGKVWRGRMVNKRKDGTLIEEDACISPVFDASGKIINYVGVKRDVSRELQLEQQFYQMQKMEAIGRLAGGVAHDFNNLLAVILMNASELRSESSNSPTQINGLDEIILAAERGANLTRQMLAFSHRQVMQMVELPLNEVIVNITKMLHRLIGEDITLHTHLSSDKMLVQGDAGMIEQVLLNLAVNARDAMPEGGQLFIDLDCSAVDSAAATLHKVNAGEFVRLTVRDTGCGIAPEHLSHIFEPFFTTKDMGKGTGLGLSTVHGIVEQHHGWVEVESQVGQGTTFRVLLPRLLGTQKLKDKSQSGVNVHGGSETILLVEDEHSLRMLALRILQQYGYRVLEAPHGNEALALWRQHHGEVDLLLTDVVMPGGISGGKLAEQMLADKPELKVVFMSGYPGEMSERGLHLDGGPKFLQKPFAPSKLAQTVRECLDAV